MTPPPSQVATRAAVRVGVTSAIAIGVMLGVLLLGPYEPVDLVFPGSRGTGGTVMIEDFGASAIPDRLSYDGQQVYLTARYFPTLEDASDIGVAEFRMRRILQPALASIGGEGESVVLLLSALGVVGVGLGAFGLADYASRHGRDPRVGYAAAVALAFPAIITTTETVAFGLGFVGLALADRRRLGWAIIAFSLAGLSRETALVMALAAALALASEREWRGAALVAVVPWLPFLAWSAILRAQVPADTYQSSAFLGFLDTPTLSRLDIVVSVATVVLLVVGVVTWWDARAAAWTAAGYLACCALYIGDQYVWHGFPRVSAAGIALGLAGPASTLGRIAVRGR
jgi:hypothetical protein